MRRKILWFLAIGFALLVGSAGTLFWASKQVPDFYAEAMAAEMPAEVRQEAAKEFVQRTLRIVEDVEHSDRWAEEFTQDQINSWLIEELHQNYPELVPDGVTNPRVGLHDEIVSLGFRYESEAWSGIVSIRVRPWVPEPNRLAIEVLSIRAGLVPMPLDELLREVATQVETEGLPITWTHRNGNDVALVRLDGDPDGPVLERLEVLKGLIRASGRGRGLSREEREFLQASGPAAIRK